LKLLEKPPFQAFFIVKKGRFLKLTLTSWLGNWSITALVFSSWLVKWEGRFVAAALDDWVVLANTSIAVVVSHESALCGVKRFIPFRFVLGESACKLQIALADVVSARAGSVGALDVLAAIVVGDQVESVADFFALAASLAVVFFDETSVALLEVKAGSVDVVHGSTIAARCDVVGTFWKTVASVVAVSSEFLLLLEPENDDLELSEFSNVHLGSWLAKESFAIGAHQIHDHLFELVDFASSEFSKIVGENFCRIVLSEGLCHFSSVSVRSANLVGSKSSKSQKVEDFHFSQFLVFVAFQKKKMIDYFEF